MHVSEIWRYPVKSMAGEPLAAADLLPLGIPGDRELAVIGRDGRIETARTRPALLAHRAALADGGIVRVDGRDWQTPEVAAWVRSAAGEEARLVRSPGADRFDVLPLSVATDGALAALGVDRRRLRPNLVVGGVDGLAERDWETRFLAIGDAVVGLAQLRARCVMTTWDPDTREQDRSVLSRIVSRFGGTFALDSWVARPGRVRVGDAVTLLDDFESEPLRLGRYAEALLRPEVMATRKTGGEEAERITR